MKTEGDVASLSTTATEGYTESGQHQEDTLEITNNRGNDNIRPGISLSGSKMDVNQGPCGSKDHSQNEVDRIDSLRRDPESPRRSNCFDPSDPRRDSLEDSIFGKYAKGKKRPLPKDPSCEEGFRRKSVCVHCWETSGICHAYGQCGTYRIAKVKCVRKLCSSGLSCRNPRCPCLHPGEWNEKDPEFTVEKGPLPKRNRGERPETEKPLGDYYRPDEDRSAR